MVSSVVAGRYQLQESIGTGGMGVVYRAMDLRLKREVAMKVVKPDLLQDDVVRARFRREALTLAGISHPNIVAVYDLVDNDEGATCLVLELLHGHSLREATALKSAPSPVEIAVQIAAALDAAHAQSVLHRDIKPDNIFVCDNGVIKLMDFGLASVVASVALTQADAVAGTLQYMSPEQLTDSKLDGRSDLYSLGVVLYECLSGYLPFAGDNPAAIILHRLNSAPEPITALPDDVPQQFQDIVLNLLQPDPANRLASATELLKSLDAVKSGKKIDNIPSPIEVPANLPDQEIHVASRLRKSVLLPTLSILLIGAAVFAATRFEPPSTTEQLKPGAVLADTTKAKSARPTRARFGSQANPKPSKPQDIATSARRVVPSQIANSQPQSTAAIVQQLNRQNRQIDILEKMLASMQKRAQTKNATSTKAPHTFASAGHAVLPVPEPHETLRAGGNTPLRASAFRLSPNESTIYLTAIAPATTQFAVYQPSPATHSFHLLPWHPRTHTTHNGVVHFEGKLRLHPQAKAQFLVVTASYDGSGNPPLAIELSDLRKRHYSPRRGMEQSPTSRFQRFRKAFATRLGADALEVRVISLRQLPYRFIRGRYNYRRTSTANRPEIPVQP